MSWKTESKLRELLKGETGTIKKDWGGKRTVAVVYPNTYAVGMSNLGVHNFYRLANERPDVVCERAFLPLPDDEILSVESQRPLGDFDVVAFSMAFENDLENLKKILSSAKLKPGGRNKLVIGGAVATLNPKLFEGLVDEVIRGDVEDLNLPFVLRQAQDERSSSIRGELVEPRKKTPAYTVIWTNNTEFGSMHLVEIQRGCPNRCKFCAAPVIYQPFKQFSKESIIDAIDKGLPHRKKIGLIGGDVLAHPSFEGIAEYIPSHDATFSPSSVRADRITARTAELLKISGHKTITLAPEAGSEALRKAIGKNISDERFVQAVQTLSEHGIKQIKLYFMIGLPDETESDIKKIADLALKLKRSGAQKISVSINPFVPKKNTALANEEFAGVALLKKKIRLIKKELSMAGGISLKFESPLFSLHEYEMQNI